MTVTFQERQDVLRLGGINLNHGWLYFMQVHGMKVMCPRTVTKDCKTSVQILHHQLQLLHLTHAKVHRHVKNLLGENLVVLIKSHTTTVGASAPIRIKS